MARLTSSFELEPRTDVQGRVTIHSDNTGAGLFICLVGFCVAGVSVAVFVGLLEFGGGYRIWRRPVEPIRADINRMVRDVNRDVEEANKAIADLNRLMGEVGPIMEPVKPLPKLAEGERGGLDWTALGIVAVTHAFILARLLAGLIGFRVMFTGTRVTFDLHGSKVEWAHRGLLRTTRAQYPLPDLRLDLHELVVPNAKGSDWRGFAIDLAAPDAPTLRIAQSRDLEALRAYAQELQGLVAIELSGTVARNGDA